MTAFDVDRLATILRDAALTEIMPRFRRLASGDIRQKTSAVDLVTEADEAAERRIQAACAAAFPGAAFIGEESTAADPALLGAVGSADLAIVVDPVDGTANFAAGVPLFAVMASVVAKGETIAGIIYDPLGDDFVIAERGAGTRQRRADGIEVPVEMALPVPVPEMVGFASTSSFEPDERRAILGNLSGVRIVGNFRCAGHEYRLAGTGQVHFNLYLKLMPWDHLAGALIIEEAGGHVAKLDGSLYRASDTQGGLLCAPDAASWKALHATIFPGRL